MTYRLVSKSNTLFTFALRLGDNALVLGQRLGEWVAHGPVLEEDLALTNVALDLVGHARLWLGYAGEVEGRGRDADRLAYFRDQGAFHNVLLVERPNGSYADTTARQFLFDAWHLYLLQALSKSADERIAAIASKAAREVAYHVRRSGDWVKRLGDGTDDSHARMQAALDDAWPYTGELFVPDAIDDELHAAGSGCDLRALRAPWDAHVSAILADATLVRPVDGWMHAGGKAGKHTEALGYLLGEMQSVARGVPAERW
jgi:ring-1,2-phenylacetyl-CoA epoxidase subunit PaaC